MNQDLTKGSMTKTMLLFSLPMIAGNLLQQLYNVADTLIVGQVLGKEALAAVGSSFTLMTFLTSILLGLCMGSGAVFSLRYGEKNEAKLQTGIYISFIFILLCTLVLNLSVYLFDDQLLWLLQIPAELIPMMKEYLLVIFSGIFAVFLYNYVASLLRAMGNSVTPLVFLAISALLNIGLDLLFVLTFNWGVAGAAIATVIAQFVSGIGIAIYAWKVCPQIRIAKPFRRWDRQIFHEIMQLSSLTSLQQSVMNFGILLVQGRVNTFGANVMAAFAAGVKIDAFAYMPVQDFGNAFSTFIAQNYGAGEKERIQKGIVYALVISTIFCLLISVGVFVFAENLMLLFVQPHEIEILSIGVQYLRIEGVFYCGIGCLFLLYGFYRAIQRPMMSVVLTVISLGTRVILAYALSSIEAIGFLGIWLSVPIGWLLADAVGLGYGWLKRKALFIALH